MTVTVDTGSYWSASGQAVLLLCIQAGGLGIMTLATLFALLLSRRLGLRARQIVQAVADGKRLIWVPPAFRYVMTVLRHVPRPIFRKLPI